MGSKPLPRLQRVDRGRDILALVHELGVGLDQAHDVVAIDQAMQATLAKIVTGTKRLAPPSRVSGADVTCKDWLDVRNARQEASAENAAGINRESDNDEHFGAEEDRSTPGFP